MVFVYFHDKTSLGMQMAPRNENDVNGLQSPVAENHYPVDMDGPAALFTVEGRLNTFKKFPKIRGAPLCTPSGFAEAGFISMSTKRTKDLVKCFACSKELDCWEAGDDPWLEHKKRCPVCPFVLFRDKDPHTVEDLLDLYLKVKVLEIDRETDKLKSQIRTQFENTVNGI